jgi:hypothetical protein
MCPHSQTVGSPASVAKAAKISASRLNSGEYRQFASDCIVWARIAISGDPINPTRMALSDGMASLRQTVAFGAKRTCREKERKDRFVFFFFF